MARRYEARERRYIADYVKGHFPNEIVHFNLRLYEDPKVAVPGLSEKASRRLLSRTGIYVDALVELEGVVLLIEAKVENEVQALGELVQYAMMLPLTPGWENITPNMIRLRLVSPVKKDFIIRMAERFAIEIDTWAPDYILEYLLELKRKRV